jgi:hypothetical protein
MGYTTEFSGHISVNPPLNPLEIEFLTKFSGTRRMLCHQGPYYVNRGGFAGQDHSDKQIIDYNRPPVGQPGLWCHWVPSSEGRYIEWDEAEKFYNSVEWMKYLIEHFVGENPKARKDLPFLTGHVLNGTILAQGENIHDRWQLSVDNNQVSVKSLN